MRKFFAEGTYACGTKGGKVLKMAAHLGWRLPTYPVGVVVFGCQIAEPGYVRRGRKICPPIIRGVGTRFCSERAEKRGVRKTRGFLYGNIA